MSDQESTLIIAATWTIPVVPAGAVLENHAVVVHEKSVLAVIPLGDAKQKYPNGRLVVLEDHVLIPGLINAHGHAPMSLFRGVADDVPLKSWLEDHIWPLEAQLVSEEFVYHGAELAIAEMLLSGTTCFADMYFFPEAVARAAGEAGIRVQLASPILDFPTVGGQNPDEYIARATELHDQFRNSELVYTAFGPHAPYTVSNAPLQKIRVLADELDVPIHMHIHETASEVRDSLSTFGITPIERLDELGLLSPRFIGIHATQLDEPGMDTLRENGVQVVHCPESNLKLASGMCPVQKLKEKGINVALGTDGSASNNDLDMLGELRTAALLAKGIADDATALPAQAALQMATLDGARALGLEHEIGSIERGKYADLVAIDLNRCNGFPVYNPLSQLIYSTHSSQVSHVWIGGQLIVKNGSLESVDLRSIKETAKIWQKRVTELLHG